MVDSANERFDWSSEIELQLNHLLIEVLQHRCATDPYALHFVDVGGNVGAKTLLASVLGCNVVTVEPQSSCQRQMQMGLRLLPEMTRRRVRVANAVISDVLGPVSVPWTTKCDGTLNVAESDPLVDMAQRTL
mmetsp:Transcript_41982/g.91148  ORF Transcript_41982/g.91148 Transcript_41982/m.91148 type:complete len:132 (+) Transcript_41982:1224-1619(+)